MEILVLIFIASVFILIIWSQIASKRKAELNSDKLDELLREIRSEIVSVAGSGIPGKEIKQVIGLVRGVSDTQATRKEEFTVAEKEALYNMLKEAQSMGANAVIDIKLSSGTYEQQGSKWQVSQSIYSGTGVVV